MNIDFSVKHLALLVLFVTPMLFAIGEKDDDEFKNAIKGYENNMAHCLQETLDVFASNNTNGFSPYMDYAAFALSYKEFAGFIQQLDEEICEAVGIKNCHTRKDNEKNGEKIYNLLVGLSLLSNRLDKNKPFHNFCHSMWVAIITNLFFNGFKGTQKYPKPTALQKIAYVIAGATHDSGHPGFGNVLNILSDKHRIWVLNNIVSNIDAIFHNTSQFTDVNGDHANDPLLPVTKNLKKQIKDLESVKCDTTYTNIDPRCFLEYLHGIIGRTAFYAIMHMYDVDKFTADQIIVENYDEIIKQSIDYTLMSKPDDTQMNPLHYVVHVADISLTCALEPAVLYYGTRSIYTEFLNEFEQYKNLPSGPKNELMTYLKNKTGKKNWMWGVTDLIQNAQDISKVFGDQVGFNNKFVITAIDKIYNIGETYQVPVLQYLKNNFETNNKFYTDFAGIIAETKGQEFNIIKSFVSKDERLKQIKDSILDSSGKAINKNLLAFSQDKVIEVLEANKNPGNESDTSSTDIVLKHNESMNTVDSLTARVYTDEEAKEFSNVFRII